MLKYIRIIFRALWYIIYIYPRYFYYYITKNKTPYEERYTKTVKSIKFLSKLLDVEYHVTGMENFDPDKNYYVCGNHQSFFDALTMFSLFEKRKLKAVAKHESRKMPVAGKVITSLDTLYLDRDDLRKSMQVMKKAGQILADGEFNLLVFPEGTRTKNKDRSFNEFKAGAFKPAYYGKKDIIPFAIVDSYQVLNFKIWKKKYHVQVHFLEPIKYDDFKNLNTQELATLIQNKVQEKYNELGKNKF